MGLLSDTGDLVWEARALHYRAAVYLAMGDIGRADRDYARVEALWLECGQRADYAFARLERGLAAHIRGDLPAALAYLDHAQALLDGLDIFMADLFVNKCTVLLAAGLTQDALREVNAAVARIEQDHGSATRRAELLYSSAVAAAATSDFSLAQDRSGEALRLFRRQHRPWWAARAELVLLLCRSAADDGPSGSPAASGPAGDRAAGRAGPCAGGRCPPAHWPDRARARAARRGRPPSAHRRGRQAPGSAADSQRRLAGAGHLV